VPVLLLACFVLSGASGLCFEVVWSRQLAQVFGSSSLAISTVLATFMGGLALGSWLGGKLADRHPRRGLAAYAVCELGIAVLALAIPLVLETYPAANAFLWQHFHDAPITLALLRFVLCALLLLPPTTLMGATLPILARHVIRTPAELGFLGTRVGALYAANTIGAVAGAGGAGFYLLPLFGQHATYLTAVSADVLLAAAIGASLAWRKRHPVAEPDVPDAAAAAEAADELDLAVPGRRAPAPPEPLSPRARRGVLWSVGISGGVAMALEVLWSRALALVIGSSIYSFTLVLVVFLLGLSAGATWIGRPAARARRPLPALGRAFLGVGASGVLTLRVIVDLPPLFIDLIEGTRLEIPTVMGLQALLAALAVAPTAACLGAVMPLVMRAYAGDASAVGRDVGRAYAANTVGAITGSFAGGFVILPVLGLENGIRLAAYALLALAFTLLVVTASGWRRGVGAALAVALAATVLVTPRWDVAVVTSGVFRMSTAKHFARAGRIPEADVAYYRDGVTTTVSVERYGDRLALKNNGKVEASSVGDMPTQVLVGLLPVLLAPGTAQKVAVVGYGSGITVGSIAEAPEVARVDVVELEPAVLEAADRFFAAHNHSAHLNPRVHRWLGDGRNFLTAHREKYDVIVSEPSNPWIAGVASLFTREFYSFAKRHLAEGGVFCQWAQLYELGPENVKTIYRTFHEAFPYVIAWTPADLSADTILVGSMAPIHLDFAALERRMAEPSTRAELLRGGVARPEELFAQVILTPDEVSSFAAGAQVNTDDNALLEFSAPRDLLAAGRTGERFADEIFSWMWPYGHLGTVVTGLGEGAERGAHELRLARALVGKGRKREAQVWLDAARAHGANAAEVERTVILLRAAQTRDFGDPELAPLANGAPVTPPDASWFDPKTPLERRQAAAREVERADRFITSGDLESAARIFKDLPRAAEGTAGDDVRLLRAYVAYRGVLFTDAKEDLEALAADEASVARRPAILYYYGRVLFGEGSFEKGADTLERFIARWPALVPE
jgi:spermidine synthase